MSMKKSWLVALQQVISRYEFTIRVCWYTKHCCNLGERYSQLASTEPWLMNLGSFGLISQKSLFSVFERIRTGLIVSNTGATLICRPSWLRGHYHWRDFFYGVLDVNSATVEDATPVHPIGRPSSWHNGEKLLEKRLEAKFLTKTMFQSQWSTIDVGKTFNSAKWGDVWILKDYLKAGTLQYKILEK